MWICNINTDFVIHDDIIINKQVIGIVTLYSNTTCMITTINGETINYVLVCIC